MSKKKVDNQLHELQLVKQIAEKTLKQIKPEELEGQLWRDNILCSMGVVPSEYLIERRYYNEESKNYVEKHNIMEDFQDFYFEWKTFRSNELFKDEDYSNIENEEERSQCAFDDTDIEGWIWVGFQHLITGLVYDSLLEIGHNRIDEYEFILTNKGFSANSLSEYSWEKPSLKIYPKDDGIEFDYDIWIEISFGKDDKILEENISYLKTSNYDFETIEDIDYQSFDDLLKKLESEDLK